MDGIVHPGPDVHMESHVTCRNRGSRFRRVAPAGPDPALALIGAAPPARGPVGLLAGNLLRAMDCTTRKDLLLFLLFGLLLLRAPQLAGPSRRPARRDGHGAAHSPQGLPTKA
jgi:hypothetical protein